MPLTRDKIFNTNRKLPTETVATPELEEGSSLTVTRLSARAFMALSAKVKDDTDLAYAHWLIATVLDDEGKPFFTDADLDALAELDAPLVERLTNAAMRLNLNDKDAAAKN